MNRKILLQGTFGGLLFGLVVGAGAMHFATQNTETFSVDKEAIFWEVMQEEYPLVVSPRYEGLFQEFYDDWEIKDADSARAVKFIMVDGKKNSGFDIPEVREEVQNE